MKAQTSQTPFLPLLALSTALLLPATAALAETPAAGDAPAATARAAVQALGESLKSELVAAIQSGGPVAAIEVCNVRAPQIAASVSLEQGVEVSRVSLKNRNPENAPNAWQRDVLLQFEQRKTAGEDPAGLVWQETVDTPDGREFRFMKAIPTGGLCLNCHGTELATAVAEKIDTLYPDDKATGFQKGDLRGAFVVIEQM